MCDDEKIMLLSFQLQDDRFQPDSEVVVRLFESVFLSTCIQHLSLDNLPLHEDSGDGMGPVRASQLHRGRFGGSFAPTSSRRRQGLSD